MEQATIVDQTRPRILMVGDSILNGYLSNVTNELDGKVYLEIVPHREELLREVAEMTKTLWETAEPRAHVYTLRAMGDGPGGGVPEAAQSCKSYTPWCLYGPARSRYDCAV